HRERWAGSRGPGHPGSSHARDSVSRLEGHLAQSAAGRLPLSTARARHAGSAPVHRPLRAGAQSGIVGAIHHTFGGCMIPAAFEYHRAANLADALALLERHGDGAKVLAGGQSLLPLLKLRLGMVTDLVDIGAVEGLDYIKEEGGFLKIGAMT